jgi:hypothetical protein
VCPSCGTCKGWPLKRNRATWGCAGCARQTSVTAGTVMHSSHLPLRIWCLAAHIITSHSTGMSALLLQAHLGLGSYKTGRHRLLDRWRFLATSSCKSCGARWSTLTAPPLKDLVKIDETEMPFRSWRDPEDRPKGGLSPVGTMFVVCAVELSSDGHPRRIRMKHNPDGASKTLHGFIGQAVEPGAHIITDGWLGYENPPANTHEAKVVSGKRAHDIPHWVHRMFSNLKTWAKGVFDNNTFHARKVGMESCLLPCPVPKIVIWLPKIGPSEFLLSRNSYIFQYDGVSGGRPWNRTSC